MVQGWSGIFIKSGPGDCVGCVLFWASLLGFPVAEGGRLLRKQHPGLWNVMGLLCIIRFLPDSLHPANLPDELGACPWLQSFDNVQVCENFTVAQFFSASTVTVLSLSKKDSPNAAGNLQAAD